MRKLIVSLLAAAAVVVVALVAAVVWVRSARPERSGALDVPGLRAPVQVFWDDHAVPQVWASSMEDALFAQGFLHARDRLWQMDLVRRAVQGRLAEVLGEPALETDRFMRRLGLFDAARAGLPLLGDQERTMLQAYADGVNAALDGWSGALPPEFLVLRYHPEPWEPVHTLAVAKMMSLTLAAYGEAVGVARAVRRLGPERASHLFPAFPSWGATILPPPEPAETPPMARALIDAFSVAAASNSWVVSGEWTRSGHPILANDPHLELQAPSLWYLVGLHAPALGSSPALDVAGVSIPGAPAVIIGRNRAIAWGFTNAYVDDVDLFIERTDPTDPGRYLAPGGSRPFEVRAETIQVKGWEAPDVLEVRATRHGPVLPLPQAAPPAVAGDAPGDGTASTDTVLSVQWTALRPSTVFRGIIGFNLAAGWDDFLAAADAMDDPHQNLVYADTAGHIGYVMGGTVPIRGDRRPAPVAPRPGWNGEWDWTGELPFDEHPRVLDPPQGFVVTANNRQTVEPVGDLISRTWNAPYRAMRIAQMIRDGGGDYTTADVHRMQLDLLDLFALRYVDRAIEAAEAAGEGDAAASLRAWDGRAEAGSHAAALFYAWNEIVRRTAATRLYGGDPGYFSREAGAEILERRAVPWLESPAAAYRELVAAAMREAVALVGERDWAASNRAVHSHALGDVALLDRVLRLNVGPAPHYGSPTTVNVAHWAFRSPAADFPFTTTAGPSMRQVVEMGNSAESGGFVIGTGQSGLPFSRHYRDQVGLWRDGGLLTVPLSRDAVERRATQRMTLNPARGE